MHTDPKHHSPARSIGRQHQHFPKFPKISKNFQTLPHISKNFLQYGPQPQGKVSRAFSATQARSIGMGTGCLFQNQPRISKPRPATPRAQQDPAAQLERPRPAKSCAADARGKSGVRLLPGGRRGIGVPASRELAVGSAQGDPGESLSEGGRGARSGTPAGRRP